jgi:hypothetical protein
MSYPVLHALCLFSERTSIIPIAFGMLLLDNECGSWLFTLLRGWGMRNKCCFLQMVQKEISDE